MRDRRSNDDACRVSSTETSRPNDGIVVFKGFESDTQVGYLCSQQQSFLSSFLSSFLDERPSLDVAQLGWLSELQAKLTIKQTAHSQSVRLEPFKICELPSPLTSDDTQYDFRLPLREELDRVVLCSRFIRLQSDNGLHLPAGAAAHSP